MAKKAVKSVKSKVPMLTNWSDIGTVYYYHGVEIQKVNKSSKRPKTGATPMFRFTNRKGLVGEWYDVKDIDFVDTEMQAENKRFVNTLASKVKSGEISVAKMKKIALDLNIEI